VIHSPALLLAVLLGIVWSLLALEKKPALEKIFHYLPSAFWCYFIPMLLSTFGWLPSESPIYDFLTTYILCACLVLLLLNINLPAILRIGPTALGAMAVGAAGIAVGAVASYAFFARWLPRKRGKAWGRFRRAGSAAAPTCWPSKKGCILPTACSLRW